MTSVYVRIARFLAAYQSRHDGVMPPVIELDEFERAQLIEELSVTRRFSNDEFKPDRFCGVPIRIAKDPLTNRNNFGLR